MKLDVSFYTQFESWVVRQTLSLATTNPLKLPQFLAELQLVPRAAVAAFSTFPELRGSVLHWAPKLYHWLKKNPDPLAEVRRRIDRLYQHWPEPKA